MLGTEVTSLNTQSTIASDTGMQRHDKAYVATSTLSLRMPVVLPTQ